MQRLPITAAIVVASIVAPTASASATPGLPVNSTFAQVSSTTVSTRTADGNTFVTVSRTATFSGTITGLANDTATLVFHSDGTTSISGAGTCLCTVDQHTGTVEYRFEGSGIFPISASGQYVLDRATGGLAGLHVEGPWTSLNVNWTSANLGGTYHFG